VYLLYLVNSLL